MAAPNAALEGLEVILTAYRFDGNELRWLPTGEPAAKACLKREAAKSWRLVLGTESCALSEIRSTSQLGPNFLVRKRGVRRIRHHHTFKNEYNDIISVYIYYVINIMMYE